MFLIIEKKFDINWKNIFNKFLNQINQEILNNLFFQISQNKLLCSIL